MMLGESQNLAGKGGPQVVEFVSNHCDIGMNQSSAEAIHP